MSGGFYSRHFTLERVSEGVYAAIAKEGSGAVANASFVDLGDRSIVFDTFNTQQAAEDLKMAAERKTGNPVTLVINSHFHGDHIRGNQVFKDSTIISSQVTYEKMREIHPARMEQQKKGIKELTNYINSLKDQYSQNNDSKLESKISFLSEIEASLPWLELTFPQMTFRDELTIYGTKRSAKLFTYGGGHSFCDAMLLIPEEKVIFMGDLLFVQSHPTFFDESNPKRWMEILNRVINLEFEKAVPGHGSIGTKHDILKIIDYIESLYGVLAETNNLEEVSIPSKYKNWTSPEIYKQNIQRFRALADGGE